MHCLLGTLFKQLALLVRDHGRCCIAESALELGQSLLNCADYLPNECLFEHSDVYPLSPELLG